MNGRKTTRLRAPFSRLVVLCILAVFLPIRAEASDDQQNYTVNGLSLKVTLVPEKSVIMVGEPMILTYQAINKSGTNLDVLVGCGEGFNVTISKENGEKVPTPDRGVSAMNGMTGPQKFPTQGKYEESFFLSFGGNITLPGIYTVAVERKLRLIPEPIKKHWQYDDPTMVVPTEVMTKIQVVPFDSQKMKALIESLGAKALGGDGDGKAMIKLTEINDAGVIPYLEKMVESHEYSTKFRALVALDKFDSDEVVAILEKALISEPDKNIKAVASHGLRSNRSVKAHQILLAHLHDDDAETRLTVVHLLGSMKTDDAASLLHQMTNDPNDTVRGEANRYLIEMKR